jgi:uncharacterized repeat protein (TIGR01451 family)
MNSVSLKQKFALAPILPLLGLIALTLRNAPSHQPGTLPPDNVVAAAPSVADRDIATTNAVRQFKQNGTYDSLQQALQAARMQAEPVRTAPADIKNASYTMSAPWRGLRAHFGADTVHVRPTQIRGETWRWDARLVSYGYGETQQAVETAEPVAQNNGIEYRRGALTEWYLNDQRGLEQGFTLTARPASASSNHRDVGPLTLTVAIDSDLTPTLNATADSVAFAGKSGESVLHYSGLLAWDANGRHLPARIELRSQGALALLIDDRAAAYPVTIDPLIFVETKLTAFDGDPDDAFGVSAAASGDTVVVGAVRGDGAAVNSGAAYVFVRSSTTWSFQQKLIADDGATGDFFGFSVAISGNTVVVGARLANATAGSAYIFTRSGTTWSQQQKLTASDATPEDRFGASVAIDADTVVVAAQLDDTPVGDDAGSAYVFVRNGTTWSEQQKLVPENAIAGQGFGDAVAISNDTIAVGAVGPFSSAYVFVRTGSAWSQQQRLSAFPADESFGASVAVSGDNLVVGSPQADSDAVSASGAAHVYIRTNLVWSPLQKLTADDAAEFDDFGVSVAISGTTIVVGADRANGAYVFTRNGLVWSQQQKLTAADAIDEDFARSVAVSGDTVVVGAPIFGGKFESGAAYVYDNATVADLLVSQAADKTSVKQNDVLTYTLTVQNFGANRAVNVIVDDTLPAGTVFKNAHANKGQFTAPPPNQTGVVTWHVGDMLNGEQDSAQLVVTVTVKGKATITNTAAVHSDTFDPNLANNATSLATSVGAGGSGKK